MVEKEQIGPRIPAKLKNVFYRHLDREQGGYQGSLGAEVAEAIENWLAMYYLINEDARTHVPPEDRELIQKVIQKHSYEINRAGRQLAKGQGNSESAAIRFGSSADGEQSESNDSQDSVPAEQFGAWVENADDANLAEAMRELVRKESN